MNGPMVRALALDALYQVLDNKVFRILGGLTLVLVLCTFLIGARSEELVLLLGVWRIPYKDIFAFFGLAFPGSEHAGARVVQILQNLFVDRLAGYLGIILAIAATAFFVPRLLEKGAADTLFSKPLSRLTLLMSRYVSGLLFIGLLSVLLVGGMHLGFLTSSGYSDPGFLWSALTLIYVFGVLHGISLLVGVLTRSTVAAILVTMLFLAFNGGVHAIWATKEAYYEHLAREAAAAEKQQAGQGLAEAPPAEGSQEPVEEEQADWKKGLILILDVLHYTLPKTADATLIAQKLRHQIKYRGYEIQEEETGLQIPAPPKGFERLTPASELDAGGIVWRAAGTPERTFTLRRQPSKGRNAALESLRTAAQERPGAAGVHSSRGYIAGIRGYRLEWSETVDGVVQKHRAHLFQKGAKDYLLELSSDPAWLEDPAGNEVVDTFLRSIAFKGQNPDDAMEYYDHRFGWTAPLKHNIFFSIGSTLAFLLVVLGIAWWRLERFEL